LRGLTGWLVAFRSDVRHEVRPVKRGERYSAVSWLTDAPTEIEDR
jgi:predicted 2-oxoglutarate/Fe(II)-dependent dioxygenase YbiX